MALKILLLSHRFYPDIGGIETVTEILATKFLEAGNDVRVVTWSFNSSSKEFPFLVIRNPSTRVLLQMHSWANVIFENNLCLRLSWPNLFFRRPSVIGVHTWINRIDGSIGWQDRAKQKWLKFASKVIACSDAVRKRCWPEAVVIENPYKESVFKIYPDIPRRLSFVFLGRLVSDKGADIAIQALYYLLQLKSLCDLGVSSVTLTIIGDGPELASLKKLVANLKIERHVIFSGALSGENLAKCLNQHRIILVPSLWEEPFGIVALEGMACGCLPIVSDGGGLPEAIGSVGLVFRRGDVNHLATCMYQTLSDPNLILRSKNGMPSHLALFKSEEVSKKYLAALQEVV